MKSALLLAIVSLSILNGQGNRLVSSLSADSVQIGEPVTLRVEAVLADGAVPHFPELILNTPGITVSSTHLEPQAVEYVLSFWELGPAVIPGIPVRYVLQDGSERILQTESRTVTVVSILTGEEQDIREIKGMIPVSLINPLMVLAKAGIIVLLILAIILIWRRRYRMKPRDELDEYRLYPDKTAKKALQRLKQVPYHTTKSGEMYYELSLILRRYLEHRFLFRAMEMTTSEICKLLPKEVGEPATAMIITHVLETSDLAKFAGQRQPKNRWRNDLGQVERIIERTRSGLVL